MEIIRTVIVLGAGASKPYGFPLGAELKTAILGILNNLGQLAVGSIISQAMGPASSELIDGFRRTLQYGSGTVDEILERKPKFRQLGAVAIAATILPLELEDRLFKQNDWYSKLYKVLNFDSELTDASWLTFVTFNYERSLEHFLFGSVEFECNSEFESAAHAKRNSIKIIHPHGSLGPYPEFAYGRQYGLPELTKAAGNLRVISDRLEDAPEFVKARDAISKAHRIVFIGFGFDERTVQRLFIQGIPSEKEIIGTTFALPAEKVSRLEEVFKGRINLINKNALDFIGKLDFPSQSNIGHRSTRSPSDPQRSPSNP